MNIIWTRGDNEPEPMREVESLRDKRAREVYEKWAEFHRKRLDLWTLGTLTRFILGRG